MKKELLLIIGCVFFTSLLFGQKHIEVERLVNEGIEYNNKRQYSKAIESYEKALKLDPNSVLANYEIALTYMNANDYENAIRFSDKVIKMSRVHVLPAYVVKGSSLNYMGKPKEAIKLFKEGIKKFSREYSLHYNLANVYYSIGDYDNAEKELMEAIRLNPKYPRNHMLLGYVMNDQNRKTQAVLCLYYFLLLEPDMERSKTAYTMLQRNLSANVEKDRESNVINIIMNAKTEDTAFRSADLMLSTLEASKSLEENVGKTDEELFAENTKSFFQYLGQSKKRNNKGLWWEFYIPFFYNLANSEYIKTFCYYISTSSSYESREWLDKNKSKVNQFESWLAGI